MQALVEWSFSIYLYMKYTPDCRRSQCSHNTMAKEDDIILNLTGKSSFGCDRDENFRKRKSQVRMKYINIDFLLNNQNAREENWIGY